MKVLFFFYRPSGGVETLNRQRCSILPKKDIQCELLYYQHGEGKQNIVDIPVHITKDDKIIKHLLNNNNYDVIIVGSEFLLTRLRKLGYKGKLIYELTGFGKKSDADNILRIAQNKIGSYTDGILLPKTSHLVELCEKYFPNIPKFSFDQCFDTTTFGYKSLPKERNPVIGWVGRLESNKNWKGFIELANKLKSTNPQLQYWMFEDPTLSTTSERLAFNKLVKKYNLTNQLTILSNIPHKNMADFYSKIGDSGGFLCSTSEVEGFGYAVVEAMSCRCPVLTTDSDGVRSFIMHDVTGKFININHINKAAAEANELMNNTALRKEIITKAYNHINVHLSPETYAQHFANMLKALGCK